jgi:hypothetical protein
MEKISNRRFIAELFCKTIIVIEIIPNTKYIMAGVHKDIIEADEKRPFLLEDGIIYLKYIFLFKIYISFTLFIS